MTVHICYMNQPGVLVQSRLLGLRPCTVPSRWRDCHFADALSPSLLEHLTKVEGEVQQNDSLTDG